MYMYVGSFTIQFRAVWSKGLILISLIFSYLLTDECVEQQELELLDSDKCSIECPTPCWESQYQYVVSSSQWPSNGYMVRLC